MDSNGLADPYVQFDCPELALAGTVKDCAAAQHRLQVRTPLQTPPCQPEGQRCRWQRILYRPFLTV